MQQVAPSCTKLRQTAPEFLLGPNQKSRFEIGSEPNRTQPNPGKIFRLTQSKVKSENKR
jgi:hypothetical protein